MSNVEALAGGGFVVTWSTLGDDGTNYNIFGQRYDAAGAARDIAVAVKRIGRMLGVPVKVGIFG